MEAAGGTTLRRAAGAGRQRRRHTAQEWAASEYAKWLPQGLNSPGHHLLIAEQEGQRIGLLWLFIHAGDRPAFVHYIEVDPAIRGQGIGRAVMAAGEQYVTEHGATSIGLHVFDDNLVARRLYDQWATRSAART